MNEVTFQKENSDRTLTLAVTRLLGAELEDARSTTLSDWEVFLTVKATFNTYETRDTNDYGDPWMEYRDLSNGSDFSVYISEKDVDTGCSRVLVCIPRSELWFCLGNYVTESEVTTINELAKDRTL